jgi:hypothetical protein
MTEWKRGRELLATDERWGKFAEWHAEHAITFTLTEEAYHELRTLISDIRASSMGFHERAVNIAREGVLFKKPIVCSPEKEYPATGGAIAYPPAPASSEFWDFTNKQLRTFLKEKCVRGISDKPKPFLVAAAYSVCPI